MTNPHAGNRNRLKNIGILVLLCLIVLPFFLAVPCYGSDKCYISNVVVRDTGNGYDELDYGFDGSDESKTFTVPIPDNSLALKMIITASSFADDDVYYCIDWGNGYSDPQRIQSEETITTAKLDELFGSNFRLGDRKECTLRAGKYNSESNVWSDQTDYRFTFIRQVVLNSITAYDGSEKRTINPSYIEPGIDSYTIVLPKEQTVVLLKPSLQIKDTVRESNDVELKAQNKLVRYNLSEGAVSRTEAGDEILVSKLPDKEGVKYIPFTVYYSNEGAAVETSDYCFYLDTKSFVYPVDHEIKSAVIDGDSERVCNKGDSVELKVVTDAEENAELSYQWYRDSYVRGAVVTGAIEGADSDTYYPETTYSRCDDYYCEVTNKAGGKIHSKKTNKVKLTVQLSDLSVPEILTESEDVNVNLGDHIVLTVNAECRDVDVLNNYANIPCTYKWYECTREDGSDATEITDTDQVEYPYGDNHSRIEFDGETAGYRYYYCICTCSANGFTETTKSRTITVYVKDTSEGIEKLSGKGSEEDPYQINNLNDVTLISDLVSGGYSFKHNYLVLTEDLELPHEWEPIGVLKQGESDAGKGINIRPFSGSLDGDGHTVTVAEEGKPLLGYVREASVSNLKIYGKKIAGYGLINSYTVDYGTDGESGTGIPATCDITNVTILSGTSIQKSGFIGGYASGGNTVNIRDCSVQSGVTIGYDKTDDSVGSFGGEFNGTISGSSSAAEVYGVNNVGGLIGRKGQSMGLCSITNSEFTGGVFATGNRIGGIIGSGYPSESAPNTPVVSINNCYVAADITGAEEVGGILGSEPIVEKCWGNGAGGVQNSFFCGQIISSGTSVGGIIGYYNSLDKFQTITNNYYLDTCGASRGIGTLKKVIKSGDDPAFGIEGEFDAEAACASADAPAFADGTIVQKLNAGEMSLGNWKQGEKYPVFDEAAVPTDLQITNYREVYDTSETGIDTEGMQVTVQYSDGSSAQIDPAKVTFSGFSTIPIGRKTITAEYGAVRTTFRITVLHKNPESISVRLILLGDSIHSEAAGTHTLKDGGLQEWIDEEIPINTNMTVKDALCIALESKGLQQKGRFYEQYDSWYVSGIQIPGTDQYLEEFSNGSLSGWMYAVNGRHPDVGVDRYYLEDGDEIVFHYTDEYTSEPEQMEGEYPYHKEDPAGPVSIEGAEVALSAASFTYNGKVQRPAIKTIGGKALAEGTDYTAKWSNASSKNAGSYSVTITGRGGYTGTTRAVYRIAKAGQTMTVSVAKKTLKAKKLKKKAQTFSLITVQKQGGAVTYEKLSGSARLKVNATTGKITVKKKTKKGTYSVRVKITSAATANYNAASKVVTVVIKVKK